MWTLHPDLFLPRAVHHEGDASVEGLLLQNKHDVTLCIGLSAGTYFFFRNKLSVAMEANPGPSNASSRSTSKPHTNTRSTGQQRGEHPKPKPKPNPNPNPKQDLQDSPEGVKVVYIKLPTSPTNTGIPTGPSQEQKPSRGRGHRGRGSNKASIHPGRQEEGQGRGSTPKQPAKAQANSTQDTSQQEGQGRGSTPKQPYKARTYSAQNTGQQEGQGRGSTPKQPYKAHDYNQNKGQKGQGRGSTPKQPYKAHSNSTQNTAKPTQNVTPSVPDLPPKREIELEVPKDEFPERPLSFAEKYKPPAAAKIPKMPGTVKVLLVSEKPSISVSIANILSSGKVCHFTFTKFQDGNEERNDTSSRVFWHFSVTASLFQKHSCHWSRLLVCYFYDMY
jgi:hypothetical protein